MERSGMKRNGTEWTEMKWSKKKNGWNEMNEWMDGWNEMDGWMDGWMNEWMNEWMIVWMNE